MTRPDTAAPRLRWKCTDARKGESWELQDEHGLAVASIQLCHGSDYEGWWLGHTGAGASNYFVQGGLVKMQRHMRKQVLAGRFAV